MGNKWDKLNEKLKDMSDKWDKLNKELDDALEEEFGSEEPKQETLKAAMYILQNSTYGAMGKVCDEEPKEETLEEAAERLYPNYQQEIFIEGAKWQAERMYSEEIDLINWLQQSLTAKKFYSTDAEDLLEQFKKK